MKQIVPKTALKDLSSENPKVKYGRVRNLLSIAEKSPERLYSHLPFFVGLLKSENNILKWMAIDVIGFLSRVDVKKRIDRQLPKLFKLLGAGKMITANHAISALSIIALAKPRHQKRITAELLKVEHYSYDTSECRNIALGNVITAFDSYITQSKDNDHVIEFIERQKNNSRNATRKKADKFLRKQVL